MRTADFRVTLFFPLLLGCFALPPRAKEKENADPLQLYRSGRVREAIAVSQAKLREEPENLSIYEVLCWALIEDGKYAEAERCAEEALKIDRHSDRAIESLAEAKFSLGKNDEALLLFEEYIGLIPAAAAYRTRVPAAYYFMGEIYIRQARYHHANAALSTAVRIDQNRALWWTRLGYAREMLREYTGSLAAYDKALELDPSWVDAKNGKTRVSSQIR